MDIDELLETFKRRQQLIQEAIRIREGVFRRKFTQLPEDLKEKFKEVSIRYSQALEEEETNEGDLGNREGSLLRKYWKATARRLHPDLVGDESKVDLFLWAREAYEEGDLETLRLVLFLSIQDLEEGQLTEFETELMTEDSRDIEGMIGKLWEKVAKIAIDAAKLEGMSLIEFEQSIDGSIRWMEEEISRMENNIERRAPRMLEVE